MKDNIINLLSSQSEEQRFLSRKELAYACHVSIATMADGRWPYSAYIRISPHRMVYPASLIREIEQGRGSNKV
jgi:hypothetical protein